MQKVLVANRGEIALARLPRRTRARSRHRRRSSHPTTPARCTRALPTRSSRSARTSTPPSTFALRRSPAPTPCIPATASSPRTATSPRQSRRPASPGSARRPTRCAPAATSSPPSTSPRDAGVPTIPEAVEPPLIVKAAAGGGGRGMRVVRSPAELDDAIDAARREAQGGVRRRPRLPRALSRTAAAHRDPAARRRARHGARARRARLLGAAPPPEGARGVPVARARRRAARADERRRRAVRPRDRLRRCRARPSSSLEGREFFFLELNGRIQVEHPVTEAVTGHRPRAVAAADRARRAARARLRNTVLQAHAVEARLYAEDPLTFLPQAGRIERLRLPSSIRVDAGVEQGDEVGTSYDPMIAKLIATGATRDEALDRLAAALAETEVGGVITNLPVPALARRPPRVPQRRGDHRLPRRVPAALTAARRAARPGLARRVPPQPARAAAAGRPRRGRDRARARPRRGVEHDHRTDAGHGDQGERARGLDRQGSRPARRAGGDEDGDAARLARTTQPCAPSTCRKATVLPAAPCSSSSTD